MQNTTWLNISGCPRSGTTALGAELNKSAAISLLHEHLPRDFFGSLDSLFNNEKIHASLGAEEELFQSIFCANRDYLPITRSIFSTLFKKTSQVIGTKCPNLHKYDTGQYPSGLQKKQIHITRHPVAVVNSYVSKKDEVCVDDPERSFCDWLTSLNYAIENYQSPDFLCLLYESFDGKSNYEQAKKIASFLSIEPDFDLGGLIASEKTPAPKFMTHPSGARVVVAMNNLFDLENWTKCYTDIMSKGRMVGYPIATAASISLESQSDGWKYVQRGFYPAEEQGSWTSGAESVLCFTPEEAFSGSLNVTINASWLIEFNDEPTSFHVYLDDTLVGSSSLLVGKSNGNANIFVFSVHDFEQVSPSVTLRIVIDNPRNPSQFGISSDSRNLGLMVRGISVSQSSK
ncbi:hypothetical protein Q7O60_11600 [Pseudomonas protegens]|uniref:hypothetical protein n=1 Tax=Pseudomonas TaxID=286 RepID=UPI001BCD595C|nr:MULTISPECIES: hypothetical protein [Pseudomonas]MBS7556929.1 hypothetical protein [Pseudomonas sp. RC4D1]MDP9503638.1 hypothetical protein [Pseudomonas protegens]